MVRHMFDIKKIPLLAGAALAVLGLTAVAPATVTAALAAGGTKDD
jgi:hypothetical protein